MAEAQKTVGLTQAAQAPYRVDTGLGQRSAGIDIRQNNQSGNADFGFNSASGSSGGPFIQPYTQEQTIEKILVIASFDPAAASTIAGILGVNSQQLRSRGVVPANSPQLDARTRNILITYFAQETLGA